MATSKPLAPQQFAEAITCAVPVNAPGLSLWSRKPVATNVSGPAEGPLSWRYDETDSMVLCENVKVPWERIFIHNDPTLSREIYIRTPAHCFSNYHSAVRFWVKLRFLAGLASRVTQATGANKIPAVQDTLGRFAALESTMAHMVSGMIENFESWPDGTVAFNRRGVYAAGNWAYETYGYVIETIRELCVWGVYQMPADSSILNDPVLRETFQTYWHTPQLDAQDRMKLFRLA